MVGAGEVDDAPKPPALRPTKLGPNSVSAAHGDVPMPRILQSGEDQEQCLRPSCQQHLMENELPSAATGPDHEDHRKRTRITQQAKQDTSCPLKRSNNMYERDRQLARESLPMLEPKPCQTEREGETGSVNVGTRSA